MDAWQSLKRPKAPRAALDPYRFPGLRGLTADTEPEALEPEDPLPPAARSSDSLTSCDRRRLDLHACLTVAGVPPAAEDLHAITVLSAADDATYTAVRRWITHMR
ncbi:hypothetical protein C0216_18010 [Streptomyces globosus]|uniref:Uncharacterized protein n=1 Tax=Streptomyces globosus TaxID=68209 RepID=A0A344U2H1_9ACTN|nr:MULTISPECIES: hypothetical protein [Streptomyces]AXE25092.1 hypothetical protein C0216_18010 [Streptomyces globosus]